MEDKTINIKFRELLTTHFNLAELQELCFDMHFNFEELPNTRGELTQNVISLINILCQEGRLPEFVELCRKKRSHLIDLVNSSHDSEIQDAAVKALRQIELNITDDEAISSFIDPLGSWREEVYQIAIEKLTQMGDSIVMILCKASKSSNDQQRIIQVLGNIGDRNAIPFLFEALESNDERTAQEAMQALGKIRDFKDAEHKRLVEILNDEEKSFLHAETAVALGRLAETVITKDDSQNWQDSLVSVLQAAREALWQRRFTQYKEDVSIAYEQVLTKLTTVQVIQLS